MINSRDGPKRKEPETVAHSKPPIKGPDRDGEGVLVGSMFLERQAYTAGGAMCVEFAQ